MKIFFNILLLRMTNAVLHMFSTHTQYHTKVRLTRGLMIQNAKQNKTTIFRVSIIFYFIRYSQVTVTVVQVTYSGFFLYPTY